MATHAFDLVIVGSGAAGLVAAIVAYQRGLKPLVVEKAAVWGGTSALSGGGLWIPNNHLMRTDGENDSFESALQYMEAVVHEVGPASSRERKIAFLKNGPLMAKLLADVGLPWQRGRRYPDYYPAKPGFRIGRIIEGKPFNGKRLGVWLKTMRRAARPPLTLTTETVSQLPTAIRSARSFSTTLGVFAQTLAFIVTGRTPLSLGEALVAQLMLFVQRFGIEVRLSTALRDLVFENGRVVGVLVESEGVPAVIRASVGVLLCAGGFARNPEFRRHHQGVTGEWSSASPDDQGDAIQIGIAVGAATALMDDAWWGPSFVYPDGTPAFSIWERTLPGSIIVDANGERYFNEAESYVDAGHAMLERNRTVTAIPSWLIMDARFRRRYLFGVMPPGLTPRALLEQGFFRKAATLEELALACGIDPSRLSRTVDRHNGFARTGIDEDFRRGGNICDQYWADPSNKPNSSLAPIERGPFLACQVYPGDLGTKGGLLTDEHSRVLRHDGTVFEGLYATGNTAASVMGRTYPGPGSTLGSAATFAFIAANHAADSKVQE